MASVIDAISSPSVSASTSPGATTTAPATVSTTPDISAIIGNLFASANSANAAQGAIPLPTFVQRSGVPTWAWIAGGLVLVYLLAR